QSFAYALRQGVETPAPGVRVRVPFGERVLTGVVVDEKPEPAPAVTREVLEIVDAEPVCPPDLLKTAARVADRFFASTGEVLKSALPARLPASGAVKYRITEKGILAPRTGSTAQAEMLERLGAGEAVRVVELPGSGAERREALRALEERGYVRPVGIVKPHVPKLEIAFAPGPLAQDPEARARALGRSRRGREV